ncbi:MAG TPA: lysylphosphatidylglycerol synthase transmembrane domain-containing protein [Streptosporangiaceae bacterium]
MSTTPPGASDRTAARSGSSRVWSWAVQLLLAAAAVVSIVLLRDELPDLDEVWRAATHASPGWLAVVVVAEAASMSAFARLQRRLLRAGGVRLSFGRAQAVTYASNALSTTLPAGPAVSVVYTFRQWRRHGASAPLATAVVIMGGVITTTAYSVIGLLTLLAEPHARRPAELGLAGFALAAGALALVVRLPRPRARLRRAAARALRRGRRNRYAAPLVGVLTSGLRQARGVVRLTPVDMGALAALAVLNWVFDIVALAAAGRALGIEQEPYVFAVAYFAAQAAGSLFPLLPGGLGAIEGSMIATLVAYGAGAVPAGAAVGLYRIVSFWGVVAAGWLSWIGLWLGDRASRSRTARVTVPLPVGLPVPAAPGLPVIPAPIPAPAAEPGKHA